MKSAQELEEEDRIAKAAVGDNDGYLREGNLMYFIPIETTGIDSKRNTSRSSGSQSTDEDHDRLCKFTVIEKKKKRHSKVTKKKKDQKHQVNFKEKFAEELHKTQNKARLLYEMLANIKTGDSIEEGGTIDELKIACESALPKIKSLLKESKEAERTEELTEVKSTIKGALLKYQDIKHGQYDTEYDVSGKFKSDLDKHMPPPAISLIDLEDGLLDSTSSSPSLPPQNELSELFGQPSDSVLKTGKNKKKRR